MKTAPEKTTTVLWETPADKQIVYVEPLPSLRKKLFFDAVKRVFDVVGSISALALLALPCAAISLIIMIDSPGNPIYSQVRLGKNEKPFTIYKFRSMKCNAERDGIRWAEKEDSRVTKFGRFLRMTRLDELPQLVNILLGQMSFVGPRPERPEFYDIFDSYIIGFRQRMVVKPGLTGLAQVNGGYELRPEEKILYDVEYIKTRSLLLDFKILLGTVKVVLTHEGAK